MDRTLSRALAAETLAPDGPRLRFPVACPLFNGNEQEYVSRALRNGAISSVGEEVARFEQEFAAAVGAPYAVAVSNGTAALHLALLALGVGAGDEVIIPDLTYVATASAVRYTGASVVLADVDPRTWTLDPADVEARISSRTRAVIAVHLYGRSADLAALRKIAREHSIRVIEDVAQALGARSQDRRLGSIGDVGCFSFYGNKVITTGEGGMITARSRTTAERLRALRNHCTSASRRYFHRELGFNYRMTALQAAVGLAQLEQLESFLAKRAQIAAWYRASLRSLGGWAEPAAVPASAPVNWLFTMKIRGLLRGRRDAVLEELRRDGIDARPVFVPMSHLPAHRARRLAHAAAISASGLSLPTYVSMQKSDVRTIADALRHALLTTKHG